METNVGMKISFYRADLNDISSGAKMVLKINANEIVVNNDSEKILF